MHCAACEADFRALAEQLTGVIAVEAEACAQRLQIQARIDAVLDGGHSDEVGGSAPVLEP